MADERLPRRDEGACALCHEGESLGWQANRIPFAGEREGCRRLVAQFGCRINSHPLAADLCDYAFAWSPEPLAFDIAVIGREPDVKAPGRAVRRSGC